MIEVTDELIEAYGVAWENTAPDVPGARRRAGLEAVFALLNTQTAMTVQVHQDESLRTWAVDRAISTLAGRSNTTAKAVTAAADEYVTYVKGTS